MLILIRNVVCTYMCVGGLCGQVVKVLNCQLKDHGLSLTSYQQRIKKTLSPLGTLPTQEKEGGSRGGKGRKEGREGKEGGKEGGNRGGKVGEQGREGKEGGNRGGKEGAGEGREGRSRRGKVGAVERECYLHNAQQKRQQLHQHKQYGVH